MDQLREEHTQKYQLPLFPLTHFKFSPPALLSSLSLFLLTTLSLSTQRLSSPLRAASPLLPKPWPPPAGSRASPAAA
jgi:hypothetical protein